MDLCSCGKTAKFRRNEHPIIYCSECLPRLKQCSKCFLLCQENELENGQCVICRFELRPGKCKLCFPEDNIEAKHLLDTDICDYCTEEIIDKHTSESGRICFLCQKYHSFYTKIYNESIQVCRCCNPEWNLQKI
jgi:hypothetical protein